MAYQPRPDGLNDLILDDGTRVVSPLPAGQLEELGHQPLVMPQATGLDPNALALNTGYEGVIQNALQAPGPQQAPPSRLDAGGGILNQPGLRVVGDAPTPSGKPRPAFEAGVAQIQAEAPQTQAQPKRHLVPIGAAAMQGMQAPPPQQRVTKIKGGDMRASFTRVPGQEVPDDVKADAINSDAEDAELTADAIVAQREELRMKREQQLLEQRAALDRENERRRQVDERIAAKQGIVDQRDREIERLRPQSASEVLEDRGMLGRLGAALTMAVAGYNAGLNGSTQNAGYQMLRDSIMDEVNGQRAAYEDAKESGQLARNDYAQALAIYGTPEAAALDMEMRRLGVAEKMLENRASKIQDQEYLQQANQVASQLRAQRAETKLKLQELERGRVTQENWQNVPDRYITTGGAPKVKNPEVLVRLPNGQYMQARGGTEARKAQEVIKSNARLNQLAGRLKGLTDTVGKREPTAAERAAAATIKSEMMFTYKDASQAGALDKGLIEAMDGYFGNATDMFRIQDVGRKLDEVSRIAQGKVHDTVRYDLHPLGDYSTGAPMPPPSESDD